MAKNGAPVTITNWEGASGASGPQPAASSQSVTPASEGFAVTPAALPAGADRSGAATTTSGALSVPANAARKALVGQNVSTVTIGFNEFGGAAVIGAAGTYSVLAGGSFSTSTNRQVNFVAASGSANVTMTES